MDALRHKNHAKSHALWAEHKSKRGDTIGALAARHDANLMDRGAESDLTRWAYTTANTQPRGNGGELVPLPEPEDMARRDYKREVVQETCGVLEHQASSDAMNLAANVDVLPAALELANSIKARNRSERLLAHQVAAMHSLGMKFAARAAAEMDRAQTHMTSGKIEFRQIASIESCRNLNASARALAACSEALLTLQKLRTGGKQIVQVQHVTVKDGGQAVVGQNIQNGKKPGGSKRGGRKSKS